ncbi:Transmembrane channel-like protein 5 [Channa argus]|uniref:Transmembrane channel-like protein 5 n=1 Tax=Channa argus TaxID=215402 RepID=A0A6G1QCK6_CHAAH|nr:Transmembrane channel-like protein 5 [Channa argus]
MSDEDCSKETPSTILEDSQSFTMDSSQLDSDYENLGEDSTGQESFVHSTRDPAARTQRFTETLYRDGFGECTEMTDIPHGDVADEDFSKKKPSRTMEDSLSFTVDICQMDADYGNLGEDPPSQDSSLQFVKEPAASAQRFPEALQMDVFGECTDVADEDLTKKIPSKIMEDSVSFNMDICQMDSDYENLGEDVPSQESSLQFVKEPAASAQTFPEALQMDVIGECTDVADEDLTKKTPSKIMEDSVSFNMDICQMDSDYENLEEDPPSQDSSLQFVNEPAASAQTFPEALQMDVIGECTDVADEDLTKKTPSKIMEDSVSFNMDICQMDSDYENLEEDPPSQDSSLQFVNEPAASAQTFPEALQMDVIGECTDVADEDLTKKIPSKIMEDSLSFNMDICQMDFDYENLGEDVPSQESSLQFVKEPAASAQTFPEALQMDVIGECTDVADEDLTKKTPSKIMEDSVSFNMDICQMDSDYENLGEDPPSQDSFLQFVNEPAASAQRFPEALQMDVFGECTDQETEHILDNEQITSLKRHNWSAATLKVISSMPSHTAENKKDQLLSSLRGLSVSEGLRKLRAMPLSLADKMELNYLQLWHSPMKRLSGRFGTGVLSYFLFLRTLLLFNLFLFVIVGLFVVFPQVVHHPHQSYLGSFTALQLLTGRGYLSQSPMFYGYYTNTTIQTCPNNSTGRPPVLSLCVKYTVPAAYFVSIAIAFFIICMILVYSMSKAIGRSFHVLKSNKNLAVRVFCCWDFKVSKKTSVTLQSEKISTQLKELLSEMISGEDKKSCMQQVCRFIVRLLAWKSNTQHQTKDNDLLLFSAAVSGINLLLPGFFNLCAWVEKRDSPNVRVYVSIFSITVYSLFIVTCFLPMENSVLKHDLSQKPFAEVQHCWSAVLSLAVFPMAMENRCGIRRFEEQSDAQLSGIQKALEGQSDDNNIPLSSVVPLIY